MDNVEARHPETGWYKTTRKIGKYYSGELDDTDITFEQIIGVWDCEEGLIDVIDEMCVSFDDYPPLEDLEVAYRHIDNTLLYDLDTKMEFFVELPTYIQSEQLIKHFLDICVCSTYRSLYFKKELKKVLFENLSDYKYELNNIDNDQTVDDAEKSKRKLLFHNSFFFENIAIFLRWVQVLNLRIAELMCDEFEKDITNVLSRKEDYLAIPNNQGALFFEKLCELTNRRLDDAQERMNTLSLQQNESKSDYVKEKWKILLDRFYKLANGISRIVFNDEYEWVQQHKQRLYEESMSFLDYSHSQKGLKYTEV
jgi:hypothetical protein